MDQLLLLMMAGEPERAQRPLRMATDIVTRKVITPEIDATAARIAYSRARFYFLGGARKGDAITRGKNKGKFREITARDGCGVPLDKQAIDELKSAARAELLACELAGVEEREAFRRARNAAQKLLHNSTRETIFADVATAQRAGERAAQRSREVWAEDGELPANDAQPFWGEQTGHDTRATLAKSLRATRDALRAYWRASSSPYARKGLRLDFRLARELLAMTEAGALTLKNGDALHVRVWRMAQRVTAGRELITPAPVREALPPRAKVAPVARETVSLATSRAEVMADNVARNPHVSALLARQHASARDLAELVAFFKV